MQAAEVQLDKQHNAGVTPITKNEKVTGTTHTGTPNIKLTMSKAGSGQIQTRNLQGLALGFVNCHTEAQRYRELNTSQLEWKVAGRHWNLWNENSFPGTQTGHYGSFNHIRL